MGRYINEIGGNPLPRTGKATAILSVNPEARRIPEPTEWSDDLVCVIENGIFDAAGYAFSPEQMQAFKEPCGRRKTWLLVPGAAELAK